MLLFEEIVVELAMIVAVVVAVGCLGYLFQLDVRERLARRRARGRKGADTVVVGGPRRPAGPRKSHT